MQTDYTPQAKPNNVLPTKIQGIFSTKLMPEPIMPTTHDKSNAHLRPLYIIFPPENAPIVIPKTPLEPIKP